MNIQEILNNVKKLDDESKILVIDGIQKMLIDNIDDDILKEHAEEAERRIDLHEQGKLHAYEIVELIKEFE